LFKLIAATDAPKGEEGVDEGLLLLFNGEEGVGDPKPAFPPPNALLVLPPLPPEFAPLLKVTF
jgi:hypothetical protein